MNDYLLQPHDRLEEWVVTRPIGKGGFAEVYLVASGRQGEAVLKLYTEPSLDQTDFFNEVMIMGLFNHRPHFVRLLGASNIDSHYQYILMEYMQRGSLRARMRAGQDADLAVRTVFYIAHALRDMHDIGICHRDVSPDNIFFDLEDLPRLGDFGLASRGDAARGLALKRGYTAPEALRGAEHSPASDIYSLGVCFLELLGGDIRSDAGERFLRRLKPAGLAEVLQRMCAPLPDDRSTADEVITALGRYMGCAVHATAWAITEMGRSARPDLSIIKTSLRRNREQSFLKEWEGERDEFLPGMKEDMQEVVDRAVFFSLTPMRGKTANGYLGLEHLLWVLLERGYLLAPALGERGIAAKSLREEIFIGLRRIEATPGPRVIAPLLRCIVDSARQRFPDGVTEEKFLRCLLEEETFFTHLLRLHGLRAEDIREELAL